MQTFTLQDIRDKGPCYDPIRHWPEDWQGTMLDILNTNKCPAADRIWVASVLLDDKTLRLFAVACARRALELYSPNRDTRSIEACDVAEKAAHGQATQEELKAAGDAAAAARDAAGDTDEAAAAARAAAYATDEAAACAARDAACAARGAAYAAAAYAAWAARDAAWEAGVLVTCDAARDAAAEQQWQVEKLKQLIL